MHTILSIYLQSRFLSCFLPDNFIDPGRAIALCGFSKIRKINLYRNTRIFECQMCRLVFLMIGC